MYGVMELHSVVMELQLQCGDGVSVVMELQCGDGVTQWGGDGVTQWGDGVTVW